MDAAGKSPPRRLEFLAGNVDEPALSRQGRLAYSERSSDINIWRAGLTAPGGKAGPPARFIASTMSDGNPSFSPGGKRIAFPSGRGGTREIWICDAGGSNTVQLTSLGGPIAGSPRCPPRRFPHRFRLQPRRPVRPLRRRRLRRTRPEDH